MIGRARLLRPGSLRIQRSKLSTVSELTGAKTTAASTSPGCTVSTLSITPPPIERPSSPTRSPVERGPARTPDREHRVDDVLGVAQPQADLGARVVGRRVAAVVRVQDRVAVPRQIVLLAQQSLAVDVDRGVDVTVPRTTTGNGPDAPRHVEDARDPQVTAAVGDEPANVGLVACEHTAEPETTTVVVLGHQGGQGDGVDAHTAVAVGLAVGLGVRLGGTDAVRLIGRTWLGRRRRTSHRDQQAPVTSPAPAS